MKSCMVQGRRRPNPGCGHGRLPVRAVATSGSGSRRIAQAAPLAGLLLPRAPGYPSGRIHTGGHRTAVDVGPTACDAVLSGNVNFLAMNAAGGAQ